MTAKRPLTEGNTRNIQKGNVKPNFQTNTRPKMPPPVPKPTKPAKSS
jgi:hypothetical protein